MPDMESLRKPAAAIRGKRQLRQDLEYITQEMYRRNKELAETNKILSLLRTIDGIVLETHDSLDVACEKIANAIAEATEYPFVGILVESKHDENQLRLAGWNADGVGQNKSVGLHKGLEITVPAGWLDGAEVGQTLPLGNIARPKQAAILGMSEPELSRLYARLPLQSLQVVKIVARNKLVGVVVGGFRETADQVDEFDARLINSMSEGIGLALDNKLLFEENQHVLHQLQLTNEKLRELDDIKDDFISMASHQLRTPLTAVKGYLSMMIDGDAGKVNATQDKMLH
jgi:GAF domain-containing protein